MVSSIKVLDRERLSIRFKDGAKVEQVIEHTRKRESAQKILCCCDFKFGKLLQGKKWAGASPPRLKGRE